MNEKIFENQNAEKISKKSYSVFFLKKTKDFWINICPLYFFNFLDGRVPVWLSVWNVNVKPIWKYKQTLHRNSHFLAIFSTFQLYFKSKSDHKLCFVLPWQHIRKMKCWITYQKIVVWSGQRVRDPTSKCVDHVQVRKKRSDIQNSSQKGD